MLAKMIESSNEFALQEESISLKLLFDHESFQELLHEFDQRCVIKLLEGQETASTSSRRSIARLISKSNVLPVAKPILSHFLCSLKVVHRTRNPEHHSSRPVLESSSTLNLGVQPPTVFGCHQAPALDSFIDLIDELQGKGDGELFTEAGKLSGGIVPEVPLRDYDDNST
jgi:hypothetical protein